MIKFKFIGFVFMFLITFSFAYAAFDFDNGVSDSDSTMFNTQGNAPVCVVNGTNARWDFSSGEDVVVMVNGTTPSTVTATNGCYQENGLPGSVCCPADFSCNTITGQCEEDEDEVTSCAFFNGAGKTSCESANPANVRESIYQVFLTNLEEEANLGNIDESEIPSISELEFCEGVPQVFVLGGEEFVFGGCGCEWDGNSNDDPNGICKAAYNSDLVDPEGGDIYQCTTTLKPLIDMCDTEDVYEVSWTANRTIINELGVEQGPAPSSADCQDGSATFSCPDTTYLPGFTAINFIIASISIGMLYFLFRRKFE